MPQKDKGLLRGSCNRASKGSGTGGTKEKIEAVIKSQEPLGLAHLGEPGRCVFAPAQACPGLPVFPPLAARVAPQQSPILPGACLLSGKTQQ